MSLLVSPRTTGTAVKAALSADGTTTTVSGYLAVFDDPAAPIKDLAGDYFTSDTYFGAQSGNGADCLFHHGIPVKAELAHLADAVLPALAVTKDDHGLFASVVLDMADEYQAAIAGLAAKGALGWSSGSAPHMVKRAADGHLKRWPIIEGSLTPQPCEPRTTMKSLETPARVKMLDFSAGANALRDAVQQSIRDTTPAAGWLWVADVFPDHAIVEFEQGQTYRVPVTADGAAITVAPSTEWSLVERTETWADVTKSLGDALALLSPPADPFGDALSELLRESAA